MVINSVVNCIFQIGPCSISQPMCSGECEHLTPPPSGGGVYSCLGGCALWLLWPITQDGSDTVPFQIQPMCLAATASCLLEASYHTRSATTWDHRVVRNSDLMQRLWQMSCHVERENRVMEAPYMWVKKPLGSKWSSSSCPHWYHVDQIQNTQTSFSRISHPQNCEI